MNSQFKCNNSSGIGIGDLLVTCVWCTLKYRGTSWCRQSV